MFQQQKFLKRTAEELEASTTSTSDANFGEPSVKLQCTQQGNAGAHQQQQQQSSNNSNSSTSSNNNGQGQTTSSEGLTKFSVEIVQQLEFTTSAANSQAQQISTNVTVKALTNASVKSDMVNSTSSPKGPDTPQQQSAQSRGNNNNNQQQQQQPSSNVDIGSLVECKQEPDNEFVDLDQCAAALEKDAATNGTTFPDLSNYMGDDNGQEMLDFKDLIYGINDLNDLNDADFMKEFDIDEKPNILGGSNDPGPQMGSNNNGHQIKLEDDKDQQQQQQHHQHQQQVTQQVPGLSQYSPRLPYTSLDFKSEMSPAAQTLKQMAEQHQHKSQQMGLGNFNPVGNPAARGGPAARSPYGDFTPQFPGSQEYLGGSPTGPNNNPNVNANQNNPQQFHKANGQQQQQNFQGQQQGQQGQQSAEMFAAAAAAAQSQFAAGLTEMKRNQGGGGGAGGKPTTTMLGPQGYKQQYSPYGSPGSMPNHGSPGYPMPPRGAPVPPSGPPGGGGGGPGPQQQQQQFNSSTPPRQPPSDSGSNSSTLQINQAQQLHINNPGQHQIQVSVCFFESPFCVHICCSAYRLFLD